MLFTCQPGYEELLAREIDAVGASVTEQGSGWLRATCSAPPATMDWCFAHTALLDPIEITGGSVNALASGVAGHFLATARGERFEQPWPFVVSEAAALDGLGRRATSVEAATRDLIQKRIARVARLATALPPRTGEGGGLFVFAVDFGRFYVARRAWFGGQRRMSDDAAAPSRSYLKVEEAYGVLGVEPGSGESVVDLGAAPGGWSYSAARRGAHVIALDNGPLKGGALGHPHIEHRREDAFRYAPPEGVRHDWLFCDMVEDPHHVLRSVVLPWLESGWCRRFVVNLKFGRADALALLDAVRAQVGPRCSRLVIRHLFHNREEFTLVGEAR